MYKRQRYSFRYFHPTEFVITNLYRDQLTRNGHPESVYEAILPAIHPETELILNADDPLSSCFAQGHEKVQWLSVSYTHLRVAWVRSRVVTPSTWLEPSAL